jgi:hypothetical protein
MGARLRGTRNSRSPQGCAWVGPPMGRKAAPIQAFSGQGPLKSQIGGHPMSWFNMYLHVKNVTRSAIDLQPDTN